MKKLGLFIAATGLVSILLAPVHDAYAHVLIRDTAASKGAILHIVPDDDPIAGEQATLYLDIQNELDIASKVSLSITKEGSSEALPVKTELDKSLTTADFVFPSQGVYYLQYDVKDNNVTYTFKQSVRISRGTVIGDLDRPRHAWAEGLLVLCAISLAILAILVFNRRHEIAKQSTF